MVEESTTTDLQPGSPSSDQQERTLETAYVCNRCQRRRRPVLELIALIIPAIFGILTPAFSVAKMLAEWYLAYYLHTSFFTDCRLSSVSPNREYRTLEDALAHPDPNTLAGSVPTKTNSLSGSPMASPSMSQHQSNAATYMPYQPYQPNQAGITAGYQAYANNQQSGPYPAYSQSYAAQVP